MSKAHIHELERRDVRRRWFVALATLLSIALLASTWIGLFAFFGTNSAYGVFTDLERKYVPEVDDLLLDLPDLSQVSRIFTLDGVLLAELHDGKNSEPVRYEEIPDLVIKAILAAEDAEFFEHEGVDFAAIGGAAIDNLRGVTRGGSTITQQVVKQNFVGDELTLQRKIQEAMVAVELERRYTKEQILEFYINSVYYGWSAYGVKTAAREYFGKELEELTIAEAATLFVPIRNPFNYDPRRQPERVLDRRNDVIDTMVAHEFITPRQGEQAKEEPYVIQPPLEFQGPADHVVAEVRRALLHDPEFAFLGATDEERKKAIFGCPSDDLTCAGGGGLKVYVTIDLELQEKANEILNSWLPMADPSALSDDQLAACIQRYNNARVPVPEPNDLRCSPTGAIASVDNVTGAIKVMASGLPFDVEQFDLAIQGKRNPGSSFKPFGLTAYLESGGSLNSFWDARSPKEIECPFCNPNPWVVRNAGGGGGGMSLFSGTQNSVNVVYAQVSKEVGPERIIDVAHRMGIQSELPAVYSLVLGAGAVSPLEMASAYSNFATNGLHADAYLIERIENTAGELVYSKDVERIQVVDPAIMAAARRPLIQVVAAGTATRARLTDPARPQGGKTGTHQNFNEAWFVGFVQQYSTAVWVGYPDFQAPLRNVTINGEPYGRVYGGTVPGPIWKEFMTHMLRGMPVSDFPEDPPGVGRYFTTPFTEVPLVVGLMQDEAEDEIYDAHLRPNVVEIASIEEKGVVLTQDPEENSEAAHGQVVTIEISSGVPPEAPLIDLRTLTVDAAVIALEAFEEETGVALEFSVTFRDVDDPSLVGLIVDTNPPPGATVTHGQAIQIIVGTLARPGPPGDD
jgi:membrane peptidoglycan carboxypeptidase